jgi:rhodanese-related sulfurtransferase
MDGTTKSITAEELYARLGNENAPVLVDVRKKPAFEASGRLIAGALRCDPDALESWQYTVRRDRAVVVYCVHGHEVSQNATKLLMASGFDAVYLEGGFEGWVAARLPTRKNHPVAEQWITRERPKIDRIACPWLISRFIHPRVVFMYVPAKDVLSAAKRLGATPYDVDGVEFTHEGERCSFDTILRIFDVQDPALERLATIVRGADTSRHDLAPQCAGLFSISLGLSANFQDDHEMLKHGLVMYDALYTWCRSLQGETHNWPPKAA